VPAHVRTARDLGRRVRAHRVAPFGCFARRVARLVLVFLDDGARRGFSRTCAERAGGERDRGEQKAETDAARLRK
jgi:hypothetical protein